MSKDKILIVETVEDFERFDIRVGQIIDAEHNAKSRNAAYKLQIDFGVDIGIKNSSAQLCKNYKASELIGVQIIAIVNLPPRRVGGFKSEVLVLAVVGKDTGTVIIRPDKKVGNGEKIA